MTGMIEGGGVVESPRMFNALITGKSEKKKCRTCSV